MIFAITVGVIALVFLLVGVALERGEDKQSERCCDHLCTSDRRPHVPGQRTEGER